MDLDLDGHPAITVFLDFHLVWAIGHPLLLICVYIFVFGFIFKTRVGATRTSRSNSCSARAPNSGFTARISSTNFFNDSAFTL